MSSIAGTSNGCLKKLTEKSSNEKQKSSSNYGIESSKIKD